MIQDLLIYAKSKAHLYRWEEVRVCPLCGKGLFKPHSKTKRMFLGIRLKSCRNCSFVIQSPRLTEESLARYYRYRRRSRAEDIFERGLRRGAYIGDFLEKSGIKYKGTVVFEVGCGYGGILEYFKRLGCRVAGCDLNGEAVAYGIKKGLDLRAGSAETLKEFGLKADIVILSHVLEHILRPGAFLKDIKDALKPGGVLYIEAPGIKSEKMNIKRFTQIGHLNYFSLDTMCIAVENAGFEFVDGNEIIQAIFRKEGD